MRCFSFVRSTILVVLLLAVSSDAVLEQERENEVHQAAIGASLRGHSGSSRNFPQRLLLAESSSSSNNNKKMDHNVMIQLKQAIDHLAAAKQYQRNTNSDEANTINREQQQADHVARHLKSAIASMHSLTTIMGKKEHARNLVESKNNRKQYFSPTEFQTAAKRLLAAVPIDKSQNLKTRVLLSSSHGNTVKQGIRDSLVKLQSVLEEKSPHELQHLSRRLVVNVDRSDYHDSKSLAANMFVDNPAEAVSKVADALARLLGQDTAEDADAEEIAVQDLLALIWIMPVSVVAGTFFWAFAGLDTYNDIMTPFEIWIFEIVFVSRVIGCAMGNDLLCTADDDEDAAERST